jgi:hypothetical protein
MGKMKKLLGILTLLLMGGFVSANTCFDDWSQTTGGYNPTKFNLNTVYGFGSSFTGISGRLNICLHDYAESVAGVRYNRTYVFGKDNLSSLGPGFNISFTMSKNNHNALGYHFGLVKMDNFTIGSIASIQPKDYIFQIQCGTYCSNSKDSDWITS